MYLVVGLGNPGGRYSGTRHNVGFEVVDMLALRHRLGAFRKWKQAEVCRGQIAGQEVLVAKPMTYMNLSGDSVHAIVAYHKVPLERLLVVHDDLDFEPGNMRVKRGGGHGGHNGLRSVISHLGGDFVRVRIGIGKAQAATDGAAHVLSRFGADARELVDSAIEGAADAVETVLRDGVQAAMNRHNRRRSDRDTGVTGS